VVAENMQGLAFCVMTAPKLDAGSCYRLLSGLELLAWCCLNYLTICILLWEDNLGKENMLTVLLILQLLSSGNNVHWSRHNTQQSTAAQACSIHQHGSSCHSL
jgi:hypothetical protein